MSSVELVPPLGHGAVLEGLWGAARGARLPHALLFQGPEGVGKFLAARWFAAGLLCAGGPGPPCLVCGACKRVKSANHPDLFLVDAQAVGQDRIGIAFITPREGRTSGDYEGPSVGEVLSLHAREGGWRVVLVREAERMNEAAQNAFLKMLEEPGRDTVIVLESSQPAALLATLKSRLVLTPLAPLGHAETAAVLATELRELPAAERAELVRWCQGAPGRALTLAARGALAMRAIAAAVLTGTLTPAAAAGELAAVEGEFPGKTPAAVQRLRVKTFLDVALELLLDAERLAAGVEPERLAHGAFLEGALGGGPALGHAARRAAFEALFRASADVAWNLSTEGIVDRALRALAPAPRLTQHSQTRVPTP